MLRCKSCLKTIETNKAEFKDATEDKARIVAPVFIVDVIDELVDGTDACGAAVWVGQG